MWSSFLSALALVLVIEGVLPFLSPDRFRQSLLELASADNQMLRILGLASMILGAGLLYLVN